MTLEDGEALLGVIHPLRRESTTTAGVSGRMPWVLKHCWTKAGLPDSLSLQDSTHAASYRKSSRMADSGVISFSMH